MPVPVCTEMYFRFYLGGQLKNQKLQRLEILFLQYESAGFFLNTTVSLRKHIAAYSVLSLLPIPHSAAY